MSSIVRFGPYEADLCAGQLRKRGVKISLRDQSFQVLASLLAHPGEVVTREELQRRLWRADVFVDFENNLNAAVARLRVALGDSADHPRFIETLPKRGYRFLAQVSELPRIPPAPPVRRPRLVVLPFVNLNGDPTEEYFSDAITDEIITALAGLAPEQLAVIARTTAMHYKGSRKDLGRIGHELDVDYVVEGAVRRSDDEVALNVQLIEVNGQAHLFARKYDTLLREIFNLPGCIAEAVAAHIPAVAEQVGDEAIAVARQPRKPTEDLAAYSEYVQGRYLLGKATPEDLNAARQHLELAIARDPEFAAPYDSIAELYWLRGYLGFMRPREAYAAGMVYALQALEIDNTRAETHALLGQFHKIAKYDWGEVHREMELALRLDPNSPLIRWRYAISELVPHGRLEEAAAEMERGLEWDPLSLLGRLWLGIVMVLWRRFERGLEEGRKLLQLDPNYFFSHFLLAIAYRCLGMADEAVAAQRRAVELSGGAAAMLGWLGLTLATSGQSNEARQVLQRLHQMAAGDYVPPTSFAWIHLGLREIDEAFEWLTRAVEECDQFMMPIKSYAFFDPIRSDPRFTALLRKMNLEP